MNQIKRVVCYCLILNILSFDFELINLAAEPAQKPTQ